MGKQRGEIPNKKGMMRERPQLNSPKEEGMKRRRGTFGLDL
jgi:hypothetical protein